MTIAARARRLPAKAVALCSVLALALATGALAVSGSASARPHVAVQTGYRLGGADGGVLAFGSAPFFGSMGGRPLARPIVGMSLTPDRGGYWLVAGDGGLFGFGDARYFGSPGCVRPARPCGGGNSFVDHTVVGMAPTPSGAGYWLADANANVFAFGDAAYAGSAGCIDPAKPCGGANSFSNSGIVAIVPTPSGRGYWLVARHGGLFAFGDAAFEGSLGCLNPSVACGGANSASDTAIVGMAATPNGGGYWLVDANANVFAFGDARYEGSAGCVDPAKPCGGHNSFIDSRIVGLAPTADGGGYWLVGAHGSVFAFGDAVFEGSASCVDPAKPCGPPNAVSVGDIVSVAA